MSSTSESVAPLSGPDGGAASLLDVVPVMPVVLVDRVEDAVPLARALVAGGLPAIELTLRTPVALEAISRDAPRLSAASATAASASRSVAASPPTCWSRLYSASGSVWVRPGRLPATTSVAPNSPSPRAKWSAAPAATEGAASGTTTRRPSDHPRGLEDIGAHTLEPDAGELDEQGQPDDRGRQHGRRAGEGDAARQHRQQRVAGDDGRDHEGEEDHELDAARQHAPAPGQEPPERERRPECEQGGRPRHAEAQADGGPVGGRHGARKPAPAQSASAMRSKVARADSRSSAASKWTATESGNVHTTRTREVAAASLA